MFTNGFVIVVGDEFIGGVRIEPVFVHSCDRAILFSRTEDAEKVLASLTPDSRDRARIAHAIIPEAQGRQGA